MFAREESPGSTIIMIGPSPTEFGGMASVVQQMLALDFGDKYHVEAFPVTISPGAWESPFGRVARHLHHLRRLQEAVRRTSAPIVHIHTCSGFSFFRSVVDMVIARRMGCRVVLHVHGAAFDEFHTGAGPLQRRLIAWSLSRADRVVALSETWRGKLREMAPAAQLVVIENAVAIPPAVPLRSHDGPCRFLLLARMDEWKGIDDLLAACADLHAAGVVPELVLAGPPGTAGDATVIAHKIGACNLEKVVRYVGPVRGEEKASLLRRADVYVQPSHNEGMPISLLEALSYGLPVVATRVGAVAEVITAGVEGVLVPPRRPDLLAITMRDLAGDPARRETMSRAARLCASTRFGLGRLRDDLVSLYDGLCASPSRDGTSLSKVQLRAYGKWAGVR